MLHRRLVGKDFVSNAQGNIRYRDVRLYRYHGFHAMDFPSHRTLTPLRLALGADNHKVPTFHVPQMTGHMDQYMLFSNFVIEVVKLARTTVYATCNVWPLEVGRTVWEIRFHFKEPVSVRSRLRQESFKRVILDPGCPSGGCVRRGKRLRGPTLPREVPHDPGGLRNPTATPIQGVGGFRRVLSDVLNANDPAVSTEDTPASPKWASKSKSEPRSRCSSTSCLMRSSVDDMGTVSFGGGWVVQDGIRRGKSEFK